MTNKHYGWALVVLVLVFGIGAIVAFQKNRERAAALPTATNLAIFSNDTYGYSFYYPPEYTVRVASEEEAIIGKAEASGFVSYVQSRIVTGTAEAGSYDAFVEQAIQELCADSGCTTVADHSAYTSDTDLRGTRYRMTMPDGAFGPVYAFNIGPNVPSARFAALLIYAPTAVEGEGSLQPEEVAAKVQIEKVGR